jgi:hypothetical protein
VHDPDPAEAGTGRGRLEMGDERRIERTQVAVPAGHEEPDA